MITVAKVRFFKLTMKMFGKQFLKYLLSQRYIYYSINDYKYYTQK